MQPTFVPWLGYFKLISEVDEFVFLDDVQFARQSWQTRNCFQVSGAQRWVSLPVKVVSSEFKNINAVTFHQCETWNKKTSRTLEQNYKKCKFFHENSYLCDLIKIEAGDTLATVNIRIISAICESLGVPTKLHRSSSLDAPTGRIGRLISICKKLGASTYVSPLGSKTYLEKDGFIDVADVSVDYFKFDGFYFEGEYGPSKLGYPTAFELLCKVGQRELQDFLISKRWVHDNS